MAKAATCPICGALLAGAGASGHCPRCLLKRGMEPDTRGFTQDVPAESQWEPPSPAELSAQFADVAVIELLGRGGMGAVYKARQRQLDRVVALKILPPAIGRGSSFAERFANEAKALARLNHPGVVTLYEFGKTQADLYFFLMEFVDGLNLRHLMRAGRIGPREALAIVPQICDALQYAHDQGIVHRDIKPENILLDRRGRVKVADFGLAKIVGQEEAAAGNVAAVNDALTEGARTVGTPQYMAPEQISHPGSVDRRADIYALGVVFYQMLTGELPAANFEPPSKKMLIDVRLDTIVLRALEREPRRRYGQAAELKTQVETVLSSPMIRARQSRLGWRAAVGGSLLAACIAGLVALCVSRAKPGNARISLSPPPIAVDAVRAYTGNIAETGYYLGQIAPTAAARTSPASRNIYSAVFAVPEPPAISLVKGLDAGKSFPVTVFNGDEQKVLGIGRIAHADNAFDASTQTVAFTANISPAPGMILLANEFVNVQVVLGELTGITVVPAAAVWEGKNSACVYLIEPDGTIKRRDVTVGFCEGVKAGISSGISPGDLIVKDKRAPLLDGTHVTYKLTSDFSKNRPRAADSQSIANAT